MTTATTNFVPTNTSKHTTTSSMNLLARISGILYLIIIVGGIYAGFARMELLVAGDAAATAANIVASEGLLRSAILGDLAMIISDVAIGVVFYMLFKAVNPTLSLLSAFFRLAQASALGLNLLVLFLALQFANGAEYLSAFNSEQLDAIATLMLSIHGTGYQLALVFFVFSILIQGYLIIRSGFLPKWLGTLVIIAALAYFVDSFAAFALTNYADYADTLATMLVAVALPVELILALWLLIRGVNVSETN
jgi:hypothetical protein